MKQVRVIVVVEADDDFILSCEHSFEIVGVSYEEVRDKLIDKLRNIQLIWVKRYATKRNGVVTNGDYSYAWYQLRDNAIVWLKTGGTSVCIGGNQTISIDFYL